MSIIFVTTIVLASAGALLGVMSLVYATMPGLRRHPQPEAHMSGRKFWMRVALTGVFSTLLTYGLTFVFADQLVYNGVAPAWWRMLFDGVAILFVYDIFYYFMHRYPFHQWKFFMRVHAVHHQSHRPIPIHAMHLHPIENVAGLGLLLLTVAALGPVHIYTFGAVFFVYSCLNVVTHAGLDLPIPYLRLLSVTHDAHHKHMRAGNYATLSPVPDMVFGTHE